MTEDTPIRCANGGCHHARGGGMSLRPYRNPWWHPAYRPPSSTTTAPARQWLPQSFRATRRSVRLAARSTYTYTCTILDSRLV